MSAIHVEITHGITQLKGRMPRNVAFEPVVSSTYFLEDGDEALIFDPSFGKDISESVIEHVENKHANGVKWKRAFLVAGHSHYDHANNFHLANVLGAEETHIYLHEAGFRNGTVKNGRGEIVGLVAQAKAYYDPAKTLSFPNNLFMSMAVRRASHATAKALKNGKQESVVPEKLKQNDLQTIVVGDSEIHGWRIGKWIIFPTPGHSPCSVTLFWPEKKALFVSDATWIGNPVFVDGSLHELRDSLEKLKSLTTAGLVDLLLPGHGQITEGTHQIVNHLDFQILKLDVIKDEVLTAYHGCGEEKDIIKFTRYLCEESMLFRLLGTSNFPKMVIFAHTIVVQCLKEKGILD